MREKGPNNLPFFEILFFLSLDEASAARARVRTAQLSDPQRARNRKPARRGERSVDQLGVRIVRWLGVGWSDDFDSGDPHIDLLSGSKVSRRSFRGAGPRSVGRVGARALFGGVRYADRRLRRALLVLPLFPPAVSAEISLIFIVDFRPYPIPTPRLL